MPQKKVLVIEDDKHLAKLVKYNLEKTGYECTTSANAEEALVTLRREGADLIILDIMLPGMDGFEACRLIKQDKRLAAIPVIMLTAKAEEVDRIVGLELGADDYIVKPFSPRELMLRIKAVLRRGREEAASKEVLTAGDLSVNIPKHTVMIKNKEIELTSMEFKLLVTFLERRGRVQTREQLLSDVWELDSAIDTRTIDTHIKRLREKMGKLGSMIETVRGLGYKFKEDEE